MKTNFVCLAEQLSTNQVLINHKTFLRVNSDKESTQAGELVKITSEILMKVLELASEILEYVWHMNSPGTGQLRNIFKIVGYL